MNLQGRLDGTIPREKAEELQVRGSLPGAG